MKRLYDINVHGAFYTAREAARNMIPMGGGSIILVSSMSANVVRNDYYFLLILISFSSLKRLITPPKLVSTRNSRTTQQYIERVEHPAVKHMAASLAVEWAKAGVRVNSLRFKLVYGLERSD
ncbi:hypothetical protein C0993_011093 [Termitomyces sp. T159_Od127]|nr:hypothetical protein C0993_011093 [Termitomyces sp. T159_Od127]